MMSDYIYVPVKEVIGGTESKPIYGPWISWKVRKTTYDKIMSQLSKSKENENVDG